MQHGAKLDISPDGVKFLKVQVARLGLVMQRAIGRKLNKVNTLSFHPHSRGIALPHTSDMGPISMRQETQIVQLMCIDA